MKLKSFGCSLMFGTDLHDDGQGTGWATPSQHSWPALLAKHLGYEYECYARPGSGNLQIWENIADQTSSNNSQSLYVIGWTWIDRFDYISDATVHRHHCRKQRTKWRTVMPIDQDSVAEMYYKELHSEHLDKLKSITYIFAAVNLLQSKNIPFIMTSLDDLILDTRWNISPGMISMQNIIHPLISSFQGQTFLRYSQERGHSISATMHPLESAHRDVADLVINNLQDYIKGEYDAC
jgi:hypothetical protein